MIEVKKAKGQLAVVYRALAELTVYPNNSRTHSDDQIARLCASITEFGFTSPILIDEAGQILAGHGRYAAAGLLMLAEVPTITLAGLSDLQKRAYVLADNKLALDSAWDEALLASELAALQTGGYDLQKTGFATEEFEQYLQFDTGTNDAGGGGGQADADSVPAAPVTPKTTRLDVWLCGAHRVMCGDATNADQVSLLMDGGLADLLLTDPPYNVAYEGKTSQALKIKNDQMSAGLFDAFLVQSFENAKNSLRPGAAFYIWHADSHGFAFRGACNNVGLQIRQCLIWVKQAFVLCRQDYHWKHEPCLYGWKDGAAHTWASDRKQSTVLEFDRPMINAVHPTMKPVVLFEYQLLNNTKTGQVVLDVFGGSGTTLLAAEKNDRIARVLELDPIYCDVIVKRWQDYTGKQATHAVTGRTFNDT